MAEKTWEVGKEQELRYWRELVGTKRFQENWAGPGAANPDFDFVDKCVNGRLKAFFQDVVAKTSDVPVDVLDVGSGPVSILSKFLRNLPCRLLAADALAVEYTQITRGHELGDVVRPIACEGEKLSEVFGYDVFDVVHISNALDHTHSPMHVVIEMASVCRTGGHLIIQGFVNEGTHEGFRGFHQWDVDVEPETQKVMLTRDGITRDVAKTCQDFLKPLLVEKHHIEGGERDWLFVVFGKTATVPDGFADDVVDFPEQKKSKGGLVRRVVGVFRSHRRQESTAR